MIQDNRHIIVLSTQLLHQLLFNLDMHLDLLTPLKVLLSLNVNQLGRIVM